MIVAGLATIPSRKEQFVNTLVSILPFVDKVNVSLNGFDSIPEHLLSNYKVEAQLTKGTDEQKFRQIEGNVFLTVDDDLIYPDDYVKRLLKGLEHYDIVTCHGRNFHSFPINSYYKSKASKYRCLDKVAQDIYVQFGGTGCMAFRPKQFNISLNDFPEPYMADIQASIKAKEQGLKIVCLAHESGWIEYQDVPNTIYERFSDNDYIQTALVNKHFATN